MRIAEFQKGFITTYTGKHFHPVYPDIEKIDIKDIAHALSLTCRGNGQVKTFFSVGQHCINCALEAKARGYTDRVALACLIHDASESYMSDVPRPLKRIMPTYQEVEANLLDVIYEKFLGEKPSLEELDKIKEIDDDFLYYDLTYLLNEELDKPKPAMKIQFSFEEVPFADVEKKYLELFHEYRKHMRYQKNRPHMLSKRTHR